MDDLEMTKLCAEAMGYEYKQGDSDIVWASCDAGFMGRYRPLVDDAQAMALLKRFPVTCVDALDNLVEWGPHTDSDRQGLDMNRCIVECVAKMQSAKLAPPMNVKEPNEKDVKE